MLQISDYHYGSSVENQSNKQLGKSECIAWLVHIGARSFFCGAILRLLKFRTGCYDFNDVETGSCRHDYPVQSHGHFAERARHT